MREIINVPINEGPHVGLIGVYVDKVNSPERLRFIPGVIFRSNTGKEYIEEMARAICTVGERKDVKLNADLIASFLLRQKQELNLKGYNRRAANGTVNLAGVQVQLATGEISGVLARGCADSLKSSFGFHDLRD